MCKRLVSAAEARALREAATRGPWRVVLSDNATPHVTHGGNWFDIDDRSSLVCVMPAEIMERYNASPNAALIAAAPDLAATVEALHAQLAEARAEADARVDAERDRIADYLDDWDMDMFASSIRHNAHRTPR